MIEDMFLFGGTVVDNIFLSVCQVAERNIRAHSHFPADVGHKRPHERIPWRNRTFIDSEGFIRNKGGSVYCAYRTGSVTGAACSLTVKCQFLCGGSVETGAAFRTDKLLSGGNSKRRSKIMPVGTSVIRQSRIHQTQAVQKLCPRTGRTADAGNSGALVERKCSRNVEHLIHVCFCSLRHAPSRVGGQGVQIAS